jgi:hypothetical protein
MSKRSKRVRKRRKATAQFTVETKQRAHVWYALLVIERACQKIRQILFPGS